MSSQLFEAPSYDSGDDVLPSPTSGSKEPQPPSGDFGTGSDDDDGDFDDYRRPSRNQEHENIPEYDGPTARTFRIRGIPPTISKDELRADIAQLIPILLREETELDDAYLSLEGEEEDLVFIRRTWIEDYKREDELVVSLTGQVATVTIVGYVPAELDACQPGAALCDIRIGAATGLAVDCDFDGMTCLYADEEPQVE